MRVLFTYGSEPHYMAPPRLGNEQINCGPFFADRQICDRWVSMATPRGRFDLAELTRRLPTDQQPDLIVCHVDGSSLCCLPGGLEQYRCPKILVVADTHHGRAPIGEMIRYALQQPFDRVVLLYDRHHLEFFRAAGVRNVHWFPALTFPHSDARIKAAGQVTREARIALVGQAGYHPRRLRLFSSLVTHQLPLSWKQVHQSEAIRHYAGSLIGLNASMNGDLNLRVFETLAGGALLLADRLSPESGLSELLQEGREFVPYDSVPELIERAKYFLAHPEEARTIGAAGANWFEKKFNEKRRRTAFLDLAFHGRDLPEFALPPAGAVSVPWSVSTTQQTVFYEFLQELHRRREDVRVALAPTVPEEIARLCSTLPRVTLIKGAPPSQEGVEVVVVGKEAPLDLIPANHVWVWDMPVTDRSVLLEKIGPLGFVALRSDCSLFGRKLATGENPLLEKARLDFDYAELDKAFKGAMEVLRLDPRSVGALILLAELAMEARNWTLAKKLIANARKLEPGNPMIPLLEGQVAEEVPPRQPQRLLTVGWKAHDTQQMPQARVYADMAIQADPMLADAYYLKGLVESRLATDLADGAREKGLVDAMMSLKRATELAPSRQDYWQELAIVAHGVNAVDDAIRGYASANEIEASEPCCLGLGFALLQMARHEEALAAFSRGSELAPRNSLMRWQCFNLAQRLGRPPVALLPVDLDLSPAQRIDQLLNDEALPAEQTIQLWLENSAGALTRSESPGTAATLGARGAVILAYQPWFGIDTMEVVKLAWKEGILIPLFCGLRTTKYCRVDGVDAENARKIIYRGVCLWTVSCHRLCLLLRIPLSELEPRKAKHLKLIKEVFSEARQLIDQAHAFVDFYQPDSIVFAQGYEINSAVLRQVAVMRGLRVVALENILHRGLLLWEDICGIAVNRHQAKNYFWRYRDSVTVEQANETATRYLSSMKQLKSGEHSSPVAGLAWGETTTGPMIVYLAQVGTDSSVLFGSRDFASQVAVIVALADYAARKACRLVVKLHPKESPGFVDTVPYYRNLTAGWLDRDEAFQETSQRLAGNLVVDRENEFDTYGLIQQADACVTINSQAGLEALLFGKEVVLCGEAYYGGLGFTHEASDGPSLEFALDRLLRDGLVRNKDDECRKFFHVFTEYYCVPKTVQSLLQLCFARPEFRPVCEAAADPLRPDLSP
ncbi:MAG: glycosyltransferase, partial [Candidatus Didemnitutus sp.]|nr:glycosyltransferase [Candidatus Didemnitutus sp.]